MIPKPLLNHFTQIESGMLFPQLAIANNENTFLRIVKRNQSVLQLVLDVRADKNSTLHIVNRIEELLGKPINEKKLNRYDHVIAIYLIVLSEANAEHFLLAWDKIKERHLSNLWWSYAMGVHFYRGVLTVGTERKAKDYAPPKHIRSEFRDANDLSSVQTDATDDTEERKYKRPGVVYG